MARPRPPSTEGLCSPDILNAAARALAWSGGVSLLSSIWSPSRPPKTCPAQAGHSAGKQQTLGGRNETTSLLGAAWETRASPRASRSLLPCTQQVLNKSTTVHSTVPGVSVGA